MLQAHQNTIQVIATALGVLSVFWGLLVVLFSLVDPIAPMFAYFAIPFILLSLVFGCKGWLMVKLFGALFILSHCLAFWTIHDIESKATVVKSSEPFNEDVFIKCSEAMLGGVKESQKKLTLQQKTDFNRCVN